MRVIVQLFFIHLFNIALVSAQITTEEILIKNDTIELPGTLSYSKKNSPLLIWIHGSGNVDRNGNQGAMVKANYIQQFREAINKNEIAFFSYDKRTSNKKNFKFLKETLFDDFANDAKKVVNYFKEDQRFSKIILLGHSQGPTGHHWCNKLLKRLSLSIKVYKHDVKPNRTRQLLHAVLFTVKVIQFMHPDTTQVGSAFKLPC